MLKHLLKSAVRSLGYDVTRADRLGADPFIDIARFMSSSCPVIFDVGANIGQSAQKFRAMFPFAELHCFEPSPSVFGELKRNVGADRRTHLWNCGIGAADGRQRFFENDQSVMNSFLPLGSEAWVKTLAEINVDVQTIDHFCAENQIETIHLLKSDTQGYDLEVLKGAEQTMRAEKVNLVCMELNFADIYLGQGSFGQQYEFLTSSGFRLLAFYEMYRRDDLAAWADALFIHRPNSC